jgi:outer membrane immunogenic protein
MPLYGTGGLTWANSRPETINLAGDAVPPSGTPINGTHSAIVGWTLGAGIENRFWNNWSVKVEYFHADLGTHKYAVDFSQLVNANWHENNFRVSLNYRFKWMY